MIVCYQYAVDVVDVLGAKAWVAKTFILGRYQFVRSNDYDLSGEPRQFGVALYTPICAWKIKK